MYCLLAYPSDQTCCNSNCNYLLSIHYIFRVLVSIHSSFFKTFYSIFPFTCNNNNFSSRLLVCLSLEKMRWDKKCMHAIFIYFCCCWERVIIVQIVKGYIVIENCRLMKLNYRFNFFIGSVQPVFEDIPLLTVLAFLQYFTWGKSSGHAIRSYSYQFLVIHTYLQMYPTRKIIFRLGSVR